MRRIFDYSIDYLALAYSQQPKMILEVCIYKILYKLEDWFQSKLGLKTSEWNLRLWWAMQLLNVGFGNTVVVEKIIAVINTGSSPARKLKEAAKMQDKLVDVTEGRRTRSILVMESNHIILSSVQPDTISQRMQALQPDNNLSEYFEQQKTKR